MQWKLTHRHNHECIENKGGKTLSYDPNLGIQIIEQDEEYLRENYILAMLLLMFDNDFDMGKEDYLLQLIVQSMDLGVLENIIYSIMEALKKYVTKRSAGVQQELIL